MGVGAVVGGIGGHEGVEVRTHGGHREALARFRRFLLEIGYSSLLN